MNDWLKPGDIQTAFETHDSKFIEKCGGIENLMKKLHTSSNGLHQTKNDFPIREEMYFF